MQLLLDDERYEKVSREAQQRGISIAAVIREAIDRLQPSAAVREKAIEAILRADPMDLPNDPADLRAELDAARSGHTM